MTNYNNKVNQVLRIDYLTMRADVIIGSILLLNVLINYFVGIYSIAIIDLILAIIAFSFFFLRKKILQVYSNAILFLLVIILNYVVIENIGHAGGNQYYFIVLPLGYSLVFQEYKKALSLSLYFISGSLLIISFLWDNPLIPNMHLEISHLEIKQFLNSLISFSITGLFIYRYIAYYQVTNHRLKKDIKTNKTLLTELHHRVKNNLNIITAIIQLQSLEINDEKLKVHLLNVESRVYTIAKVHEMLYMKDEVHGFVKLNDYVHKLTSEIISSISPNLTSKIVINSDREVFLDEAVPIGLIINELILNSNEHSFQFKGGEISLTLYDKGERMYLAYNDDGENFDFYLNEKESIGLTLINTLIVQLGGQLSFDNNAGYTFSWPKQ